MRGPLRSMDLDHFETPFWRHFWTAFNGHSNGYDPNKGSIIPPIWRPFGPQIAWIGTTFWRVSMGIAMDMTQIRGHNDPQIAWIGTTFWRGFN